MWLRFDQVEQLGITPQWIRQKVKNGEWISRSTGVRGRNGKEIREIQFSSLPPNLQSKWFSLNEPVSEAEEEISDSSLSTESKLLLALQRYEPKQRNAFRDEAIRLAKIVARYELINPKTVKNSEGKYEFVPEVWQLCEETVCSNPICLAVEPSRAIARSPYALDKWWRKSKTEGLAVFLRKPSKPPEPSDNRTAQMSLPAVEWVNKHWRTFASSRHLYKALKKEASQRNWQIPSESWVYRRWKDIPKIVSTTIQKGVKTYNSKYASYIPRTFEDLEALQVLCGDHSVRDVTVLMPDGSLVRPWLTLWYDLRTGLIWGWHLDIKPSSVTAGLAYANGVKTWGAQPTARSETNFYSYLYTDQGKDYKSQTWDGKTLVFKEAMKIEGGLELICHHRRVGFFDETGIKHILARGYNAKEKPVERVHRDISDWEQNYFGSEYCGRDAKNKPEKWQEAWNRHQKLKKKFKDLHWLIQESPFMTFDDYKEMLVNGFIAEYNSIEHTRTVLGGRKVVPLEEFQNLYKTHYEIDEESLALLLMKTPDKPRMIGKNGVSLTFGGRKCEYLHPAMGRFKGKQIEVRYSDSDYSHIWAILPATQEEPSRIVKAELVNRSPLLNLNKQTATMISKQVNHERKLIRDFHFLNQSNLRGETTEERVANLMNQEMPQEMPQEQKIAVNEQGRVHNLTRFDRRSSLNTNPTFSTERIRQAEIIDFGSPGKQQTIKEEWEEN